jgi:hypothetical protein
MEYRKEQLCMQSNEMIAELERRVVEKVMSQQVLLEYRSDLRSRIALANPLIIVVEWFPNASLYLARSPDSFH